MISLHQKTLPTRARQYASAVLASLGLRSLTMSQYAHVLKGPAHPAENGHDLDADAIPYSPLCADPFPRRPREVICELMQYQVPLQANTHVGLAEHFLLDKQFVKYTKVLVHHGRQGYMADHIATARQLNLANDGCDITAIQLYRWGKGARDSAYMSHVAQRLKLAKLNQKSPTGFTAEDQARVQAHQQLQSQYAAEASQTQSEHQAVTGQKRQAPEEALPVAAQNQADLKAKYSPVSELPHLSKADLLEACYVKALAAGSIQQGAEKTKVLSALVLDQYSAEVRHEELLRFYQNPVNKVALATLARERLGTVEEKGSLRAAKRFKTLLDVCDF